MTDSEPYGKQQDVYECRTEERLDVSHIDSHDHRASR